MQYFYLTSSVYSKQIDCPNSVLCSQRKESLHSRIHFGKTKQHIIQRCIHVWFKKKTHTKTCEANELVYQYKIQDTGPLGGQGQDELLR